MITCERVTLFPDRMILLITKFVSALFCETTIEAKIKLQKKNRKALRKYII